MAGCGGSETTTVVKTERVYSPQAIRDQDALAEARDTFVAACVESGRVPEGQFASLGAKAANIAGDRPDQELPNGSTPAAMYAAMLRAVRDTGACSIEAEVIEMTGPAGSR